MGVVKDQLVKVSWAYRSKTYYLNMGMPFTKIGDEFLIHYSKLPKNACVDVEVQCNACNVLFTRNLQSIRDKEICYCSKRCAYDKKMRRVKFKCGYCGKEGEKTEFQFNKHKNHYCGNECASKIINRKKTESYVHCICEQCSKGYTIIPSQYKRNGVSRFCSKVCRNKWDSLNKRGKNHHSYNSVSLPCTYCGNNISVQKHKKDRQTNHFCDVTCRQKCYSEVWSQSEEWKLESSKRAVRMLTDGLMNHTDTTPQKIVNNLLQTLEVDFINEYNCDYYSIDIFLPATNLMIEVMGTYWHTDHREYQIIEYDMQYKRILADKSKNTYLTKNFNTKVLYLWEIDIIENHELCEKLLTSFIKSKGLLPDYNSFNYFVSSNGELTLKEKIVIPYFKFELTELKKIISYKDGTNIKSHKDLSKWITFNCEYCNKEKEQLLSRYLKSNHHSCSRKCAMKILNKSKKQTI